MRKSGLLVTWVLLAVAFASFLTASFTTTSRPPPRRSPMPFNALIPTHGAPERKGIEGEFITIGSSFGNHSARINGIAFSGDGSLVATASSDGLVHVWDSKTGEQRVTLKGHERGVQCVAFGGEWIATGGWDGTARVWRAETGAEVGRVKLGDQGATCVAVAGERLIVGDGEGSVGCWDWKYGGLIHRSETDDGQVTCLATSRDGVTVAAGFARGAVRRWVIEEWRELAVVRGHVKAVGAIGFVPDGRRLVTATVDGVVHVTDLRTQSTTYSRSFRADTYALSPEGGVLACVTSGQPLEFVAVLKSLEGRVDRPETATVTCIAVSTDGGCVAMGRGDATIRLFRRK